MLTLELGEPGCEFIPSLGEAERPMKDSLSLVLVSSSIKLG